MPRQEKRAVRTAMERRMRPQLTVDRIGIGMERRVEAGRIELHPALRPLAAATRLHQAEVRSATVSTSASHSAPSTSQLAK